MTSTKTKSTITATATASNNEKQKKRVLQSIKKKNFGTKNLPDAIKWHCSYYWKHCLNKREIKNSLSTKKMLEQAIAIPINYRVKALKYERLAKNI